MAQRFVNIDRHTPMLLPPDLREWVPEDDLVHFVIEAVDSLDVSMFKTNRRGTGNAQYPPRTMLALLIFCYANGIFSSRRIEKATYRDLAVRYLTADTHPDHDTICAFRRENLDAFKHAFVQVLHLAQRMGLLKLGTVSIDGTHIHANASKDRNVRYDRMLELEKQLAEEVERLLAEAENADRGDGDDGQKLPGRIARLSELRQKIQQAREQIEREQKQQAQAQQPAYQKKLERLKERGGYPPNPPQETPDDKAQRNLTDGESRLMRKTRRSSYEQAYNAQAAVDAEGSMLVLAERVSQCAGDGKELEPTIRAVQENIGQPTCVLADTGYSSAKVFGALEGEGFELLVAVGRDQNHEARQFDFRPPGHSKPPRPPTDERLLRMKRKLESEESKQKYRKRKQTVEPVFGIIKSVMGFRQFLMRGLAKVSGEWSLVTLAYNMKRLHTLRSA